MSGMTRTEAIIGLPLVAFFTTQNLSKTMIGITGTFGSILSLGLNRKINAAANYTKSSNKTFRNLYAYSMIILNPNAVNPISNAKRGTLTKLFQKSLFHTASNYSREASFIEKHIYSRVAYAMGTAIAPISRITDFAFGVFAVALSMVTYGRYRHINQFAQAHINMLGFIDDVCHGVRGVINPEQFNNNGRRN